MARNLKESSVNASHPNATNHHLIKGLRKGFSPPLENWRQDVSGEIPFQYCMAARLQANLVSNIAAMTLRITFYGMTSFS